VILKKKNDIAFYFCRKLISVFVWYLRLQCSAYYQRSGRASTLGAWGSRSCTWIWTAGLMCCGWPEFWGIALQRVSKFRFHLLNFALLTSCQGYICKSLGSMQTFYRLYNFINLHCIPFIEPLSHLIGSAHLRNGDFEKDGTKDEFQCSLQNMLFSDCMQRFLYVRCYNSSEFTAALKASSLCMGPISHKITTLLACSYICCSPLPWAVVNKQTSRIL